MARANRPPLPPLAQCYLSSVSAEFAAAFAALSGSVEFLVASLLRGAASDAADSARPLALTAAALHELITTDEHARFRFLNSGGPQGAQRSAPRSFQRLTPHTPRAALASALGWAREHALRPQPGVPSALDDWSSPAALLIHTACYTAAAAAANSAENRRTCEACPRFRRPGRALVSLHSLPPLPQQHQALCATRASLPPWPTPFWPSRGLQMRRDARRTRTCRGRRRARALSPAPRGARRARRELRGPPPPTRTAPVATALARATKRTRSSRCRATTTTGPPLPLCWLRETTPPPHPQPPALRRRRGPPLE